VRKVPRAGRRFPYADMHWPVAGRTGVGGTKYLIVVMALQSSQRGNSEMPSLDISNRSARVADTFQDLFADRKRHPTADRASFA